MSYQPKDLRSARGKPAAAGAGKMSPARRKGRRKASRQGVWQHTWVRVLLIVGVVALPLLAAELAGPAIRGGNGWSGMLRGMQLSTGGQKEGETPGDTKCGETRPTAGGRTDFGQLSVKLFNPITRCRLQADFQLEGVAVMKGGTTLERIVKNKYRFIREQATIAVRNCSAAELADPKLKLLQRRVLIRINRALERPLLKSVDLDHFTLSEATPELDLMGDDEDADEEK